MKDAEKAVEKALLTNPPRLVIVGGPNGAGKTTLVLKLMEVWQVSYLGADRVAEELGLGSMGADAIRAGREFVERIDRALTDRVSILLESTLSGLATRRLIQRFRDAGYDVTVVLSTDRRCASTASARVSLEAVTSFPTTTSVGGSSAACATSGRPTVCRLTAGNSTTMEGAAPS